MIEATIIAIGVYLQTNSSPPGQISKILFLYSNLRYGPQLAFWIHFLIWEDSNQSRTAKHGSLNSHSIYIQQLCTAWHYTYWLPHIILAVV